MALGAFTRVGRSAPSSVLVLKPTSLGDVVQALPVLRLLKRHLPQAAIYWWVDADLSSLFDGDADLAGLFLFQRRRWASPRYWPEAVASVLDIRRHRFDWVIDLQALARSSLVAWCARGTLTVGLDDKREAASALYDLSVPRPAPQGHAVDWYLAVLSTLGIPVSWDFEWLPVNPRAQKLLAQKWRAHEHAWVAVHPGARWLNKRWSAESFARLLSLVAAARPELRFVVLGAAADVELGRIVAQGAPDRCLDLTGQTTLPEMVEWIRSSRLLISNDSGPMHVAAALGKPVVALFGPTDPRRTGPYGQEGAVIRQVLPCVPCLKPRCHYREPLACLRSIQPERVARTLLLRLEGASSPLEMRLATA